MQDDHSLRSVHFFAYAAPGLGHCNKLAANQKDHCHKEHQNEYQIHHVIQASPAVPVAFVSNERPLHSHGERVN